VTWYEYEGEDQLVPNYYPNKTQYPITCYHLGMLSPASTRFAIIGSFPGTLTLGAYAPFTTQYGMHLLDIYDKTGNVITTEYALSVSSDGTQATFPFPASLTQSGYSLAVENQIGSSPGFMPAGTNLLSIASSQSIAGNPFGVAAGAQTDAHQECLYIAKGYHCESTSTSFTFPIVTLYSANQVMVGSVTIEVGASPTAVAAYSSGAVTTKFNGGGYNLTDTFTGTTRAVVANSGSNSIGILDIVNDVLLFNVTVGNQPVALAVSSDGSTAYVANYTDGTVTQVNLASGTARATIAVGGNPTSVALTAAGALWVGGRGFLTQINTQTMGVVATQSVPLKTIIALGYSDSVSQLVAATTDVPGNVYVDEINPGTVQTGGTYQPLASAMVSGLGTHLGPGTFAGMQSFTALLANANLISANQVGAPPLVVQDGWAVVTATPTGFTITDISGQVVLVSETTPAPVSAIAVDPKLNVAYLTMPDANTLLTVPQPGTQ